MHREMFSAARHVLETANVLLEKNITVAADLCQSLAGKQNWGLLLRIVGAYNAM